MDSFIKWMGGKSRLREEIISLIPCHKTYVEPFGGAGWVLFGKPPSPVEFFNDIDTDLINLYLAIRERLDDFIKYFENISISEYLFNTWSLRYASTSGKKIPQGYPPGRPVVDLERAAQIYYIILLSFNGILRGKPAFAVANDRPPGFLKFYKTDWDLVHNRLKRVTILNRDFEDVINYTDGSVTVYYFDPPYLCATISKKYYQHSLTLDDHKRLSKCLDNIEGKFILSYGDDPEIRDIYSGYNILIPKSSDNELLILNYQPPKTPFYKSSSTGMPEQDLHNNNDPSMPGLPLIPRKRKARYDIPNCPNCGGRLIVQLYERVTYTDGRRNYPPTDYKCLDCRYVWPIN